MKRILLLLAAFGAALSVRAQSLDELLLQLDATLSQADRYAAEKEVRIKTIENNIHSRGVSAEQRFQIYGQLYREYLTYNFDQASAALDSQEEAAFELGNRAMINEVLLSRAMINATGGLYLEASQLLQQIDTTIFTPEQQLEYWNTQQRFWYDYRDYLGEDLDGRMASKIAYYRNAILSSAPENSVLYQGIAIRRAMDEQNWGQADFLCKNLLAKLDPASHDYANWAYYEARICEQLDRSEEMMSWFILSAMADLKTATKDNASLCSLSQELFNTGQVDRAFRYIRASLDDALFYNARLRQWQIAAVFPHIQAGYENYRNEQVRRSRISLILVSLLTIATLLGAFLLLREYRRQKRLTAQVEQMNRQIQEFSDSLQQVNASLTQANSELSEANAAKEEYISLFLSLSSGYIDKMKKYQSGIRKQAIAGHYDEIIAETSSHALVDDELKHFYTLFDQTFLKLYPKFVEQFNALLRPDARIATRSGELTTELRIFALIRLGITQSSQIASILRYSVNTIYNYRAQLKNAALEDRDHFEEKLMHIGY